MVPTNTEIETALSDAIAKGVDAATIANMRHLYDLIVTVGDDPRGTDLDTIRDAQGDKVMTVERYFQLKMGYADGFQMILNEWRVGIVNLLASSEGRRP